MEDEFRDSDQLDGVNCDNSGSYCHLSFIQ